MRRGLDEYHSDEEIMPVAQRQGYYLEKVQKQISYAYENAPAMRARMDSAGVAPKDIRRLSDLEAIPVMSKDSLIEARKTDPPWGGLIGVPAHEIPRAYLSPGPIYDVQSTDDNFFKRWRRRMHAHGFRAGDIVVNTFSYHMTPAGHWFDEAIRQIGATVIPMGPGNTELQAQVLRDMRVTGWTGMPSFLMAIFKKASELDIDPERDFCLRAISAGGEMGGAQIRQQLFDKYGIVSYDSYGTADVGLISYECRERSGMHIHEEIFVEIVDEVTGKQLGPGEVGQVVVTPFDRCYPLLRFGTGDLSSYMEGVCGCGRTSARLKGILGRVGQAVRIRGMFLHPRQMKEVMDRFGEIEAYQAEVSRIGERDRILLKIQIKEGLGTDQGMIEALRSSFEDVCRLRLDEVVCVGAEGIADRSKKIVDNRIF
ncbi:MAG: phenylacetate--CoA ligase family protein [Desulfobacteraceae bacterium]|jgi:phenylacetate-CoA ligase|nr:MAG: phenylacetate--CoA ligase family protein [Desulfobacteraceae bacterium]